MDRVFHHDDTMYEAATKVYVKTDGYAYLESDFKTKVSADVLEELFIRGLLIVDSGVTYKPVSLKVVSKVATVTYVKTNGTTATQGDLATAKSA